METNTTVAVIGSTGLFKDTALLTDAINEVRQRNADTENKPHPKAYVLGVDNASIATSAPSLMAADAAAQVIASTEKGISEKSYQEALLLIGNWDLTDAQKDQVCIQAHLAWRAQQPLISLKPEEAAGQDAGTLIGRLTRKEHMSWADLSDDEKWKDELRIRNAATVLYKYITMLNK